jgi:hypothetical protein
MKEILMDEDWKVYPLDIAHEVSYHTANGRYWMRTRPIIIAGSTAQVFDYDTVEFSRAVANMGCDWTCLNGTMDWWLIDDATMRECTEDEIMYEIIPLIV